MTIKEVPFGTATGNKTHSFKRKKGVIRHYDDDEVYTGSTPPKAKCNCCNKFYKFYEKMTYCSLCDKLYCHDCFTDTKKHGCYEKRICNVTGMLPLS